MIHYHGTPISGPKVNAARFLAGRHALVSHHHPDQVEVAAEVCQSFVLDNGAFSHFTAGKPKTEWGDYYEWCALWLALPTCDWALIPDAIGGTAEQNDALLREWPHGPSLGVPVYHLHEPVERLAQLAQDWPRVALGSSGDFWQVGTPAWWGRMDEMMRAVCDDSGSPRCRLHGLRMLNTEVFTRLPLASADSVNCAMNGQRKGKQWQVDPVTGATILANRIEAHNSAKSWSFGASSGGMAPGLSCSATGAREPLGAVQTTVWGQHEA